MAKEKKKGRPPVFLNAKDMQDAIISYVAHAQEEKKIINKAGFCVFTKIHRDTYNEYKKREAFTDTIKALESQIEEAWIQRLNGNAPTGAIFYLKNAFRDDYRDKHETDITSDGKPILQGVEITIRK